MAFLERAQQIALPPPAGSPYGVPVPNSEQSDRSAVYRHWRFQNELLKSMDPNVCGKIDRMNMLAVYLTNFMCRSQRRIKCSKSRVFGTTKYEFSILLRFDSKSSTFTKLPWLPPV